MSYISGTNNGGAVYSYSRTLAAGTAYTYRFEAYDSNSAQASGTPTNNQSGPTVDTTLPDLVISSLGNPPASVVQGGQFPVVSTTLNQGNGTAGAFDTRHYLSVDNIITNADLAIPGTVGVGGLLAKQTASVDSTITLPLNIPPGTYFFGACADALQQVLESDETNNCRASTTTVTITGPGSLQFSSASYTVAENGGPAVITVTRTGGSNGAVGVTFTTSSGTAQSGLDYTAVNQVVNFANGDTASKTVNVPIINDTLFEGNETVNLTLSNPTGGASLGNPSTAVLTIVDDDPAPATIQYTSFQGETFSLYPWYGQKIVLLTLSGSLNANAMQAIVQALDAAYGVYQTMTGREPTQWGPTFLNGRSTIAEVPDGHTCGAGCAYIGFTGIEIDSTRFGWLYDGYVQHGEYDHVPFYELGHNFWSYGSQLGALDPFVGGFAIANRFISMELAGLPGGPFNQWLDFQTFKNSIVFDLLDSYLADSALNWQNTLMIGQAPANQYGWSAGDLAAAMFYRIFHENGSADYDAFYQALAARPQASSPVDAVNNFINAALQATGQDYTYLFCKSTCPDNIPPATVIFHDDMEHGAGGWKPGTPWALTPFPANSSAHSWTDSPNGNYANNANASLVSPPIDLTGRTTASLSFWHRYDFASGDGGNVWISPAGGPWTYLRTFTGTNLTWHEALVSLDAFVGQSVEVLFQVASNSNGTADGWYIDYVTVSVPATNQAPTDIALNNNTVAEGQPIATTVGTLSTSDPDVGNTFTYTLVAGTGGTDNASFQIAGNLLKTNAVFDFETKSSYGVRVRSTDQGGLSFDKAFTITVTNANEAPSDILLSNSTIGENAGANAVVGTLSGADPDAGQSATLVFSLPALNDNASFNISGTSLRANASFDFETKSTYTVTVRATDSGALTFDKQFTITVINVNEAPTDIALNNNTVAEGQPAATTVGTLSTSDPDVGNTFTYTLVAGTGGTDNASFQIAGNLLKTNAVFDFATKSSYSVRVRSTDQGGLSFEKAFTITVTNVNFLLTVSPVPTNGNVSTTGISCGTGGTGDCSEPYTSGTNVTLPGNPATGFQVGTWTGCTPINNNTQCTVSMTQARTVSVTFNQIISSIFYVEPANICGGNTPCYSTIQAAIDAAGDGTAIKVAQGTYLENLSLSTSKNFILQGGWNASFTTRSLNPALTSIDGDLTGDGVGDGPAVTILAPTGVSITVEIDRFTIENGNTADGGGIFAFASNSGVIELTLNANIIRNNRSTNSGGGVAMYAQGAGANAHATLTNNVIYGNDTTGKGGGFYAFSNNSSNVTANLINNTITDNTSGDVGGGLRAYSSAGSVTDVTVKNSIIWGNAGASGHDIAIRQSLGGNATVHSSFNDVGDILPDADAPGTYDDQGDNIDANPLFANVSLGDLHLGVGSPAKNAGTPTGAPGEDFEGHGRPQNFYHDIGADERIDPSPGGGLGIGTVTLRSGEIGVGYGYGLEILGGQAPYSIVLTKGALPAGVQIVKQNLLGTPTAAKKFKFTIKVTDSVGTSVSRAYTLTVLKAVTISSKSLKAGTVGRSYNVTLKATGGAKPYEWDLLPGTAPAWLNFDGATGRITGIPTSPGSFDLTFQVGDALGGQAQKTLTLTVR